MKTLFEKIRDDEIPSFKIYEDDDYFAILDIHPKTRGHVLLITKKPHKWVLDVPDMGGYFSIAQYIGKHLKEKLGASYISFQTFGTDIPHAHVHIVPFYEMTEKYSRYEPKKGYFEETFKLLVLSL